MTRALLQAVRLTAWLGCVIAILSGCQRVYYETMEAFGYHKRDLLTSRVEAARDVQREAKEQFRSALEQFSAVLRFHGGELERQYNLLKAELDQSEAQATAVRQRIDAVASVAEALFEEWEAELEQYNNERLRRASARQLVQTRQRYAPLIRSMRRAEAKITPVLAAFRDQVLFLKHNLNARAIASLQNEFQAIEADITALVRELEASIAQADAFIKDMGQG